MRRIALLQLGVGRVGLALVQMVQRQRRHIEQRLGLRLVYAALADSHGLAWAEEGLDDEQLGEIVRAKAEGRGIASLRFGQACAPAGLSGAPAGLSGAPAGLSGAPAGLSDAPAGLSSPAEKRTWPSAASVDDLLASSFAGFDDGIVVDVTAAEGMETPLESALRHGRGVVLANKKPLTVPLPRYRQLMAVAGRRLRYEATVGAGLPVIATLQMLLDTGDQVQRIEGCLSGTLGYLCHCLQEEMAFSAAVREAQGRGYTEPDPRQDLSGLDVARKALILARTLGLELELADVEVEACFPPEMAALSVEEFMASLERLDGEYERQAAAARQRGGVLRYVAEVEEGCCRVGWREVPREELMAALRGPDNIVCFHTARYSAHPLVIVGPGAGPEVTAAGVLADILALAQQPD